MASLLCLFAIGGVIVLTIIEIIVQSSENMFHLQAISVLK